MLFLLFTFLSSGYSQTLNCAGSAFIVNASSASGNHCDFYRDLDRMNSALNCFSNKFIYSAEANNTNESNCSEKEPWENKHPWDYENGKKIPKKLYSKESSDFNNSQFKLDLEKYAQEKKKEPLLLYFSDHGTKKASWGEDYNPHFDAESGMSFGDNVVYAKDYWETIESIQKVRHPEKMILMQDHCYSEGMLEGIVKDEISGINGINTLDVVSNVCGVSASSEMEYSYTGETMAKYLDRMKVNNYKSRDKNEDSTISVSEFFFSYEYGYASQSTPKKSSDVYLKKYLDRYAEETPGFFKITKLDDINAGLSQNNFNGLDCALTSSALTDVEQAMTKIAISNALETYKTFLTSKTSNYYNGAGFGSRDFTYEELLNEEARLKNLMGTQYNKMVMANDNYYNELGSLWSPKKTARKKSLEMKFYSSEMSPAEESELKKLNAEYETWTMTNENKVNDLWNTKYQPQVDIAKSEWAVLQKTAGGLRRLKKTLDGINGILLMSQRNDLTGIKNLTQMLQCEETELVKLK